MLSGDLSAWKARILLMLALQADRKADSAVLTELFFQVALRWRARACAEAALSAAQSFSGMPIAAAWRRS